MPFTWIGGAPPGMAGRTLDPGFSNAGFARAPAKIAPNLSHGYTENCGKSAKKGRIGSGDLAAFLRAKSVLRIYRKISENNPIGKWGPPCYGLSHPNLLYGYTEKSFFFNFSPKSIIFTRRPPAPPRVSAVVMLSAKRVFGRIYKKCPPGRSRPARAIKIVIF